ncbi:MAG: hypothetical protein EBZ67_08565, partial [Chitinophagia bacterium]|nr:hypothetical protein [Chitinophagia bacterium]
EEHREEFDDREPSRELPDRILAALGPQGQSAIRRMPWMPMAAATLATGLLLAIATRNMIDTDKDSPGLRTTGNPMTKTAGTVPADSSLRLIDSARALQLEAISREAMARQSELESLRKDDPALYQRFLNDLAHLDSNYRSLREMLDRMPNQRQVLQAMEENLRTRLWMLERQGQLTREARESKKSKS